MINELTPEQEKRMPEYVDKWIGIGTDTSRFTLEEATEIIHNVQRKLLRTPEQIKDNVDGKTTPVFVTDNPLEAWIACNYVQYHGATIDQLPEKLNEFFSGKKIKLEEFVSPYLMGSVDAPVLSYYDYFQTCVGVSYGDVTENFEIWKSTSKLGAIFPLENICIVSQKPTLIKLNENRVAHCDGGPAITFAGRGNLNIYILNNVRVPEWLATTNSGNLTIQDYNRLTNADHRAEFVKKFGVERMLEMGKKIDSFENYDDEWWTKSEYELWDMNVLFAGVEFAPHLKMLNQTTGVWHVEAVSPTCRTLPEAIQDRMGDLDIISIS